MMNHPWAKRIFKIFRERIRRKRGFLWWLKGPRLALHEIIKNWSRARRRRSVQKENQTRWRRNRYSHPKSHLPNSGHATRALPWNVIMHPCPGLPHVIMRSCQVLTSLMSSSSSSSSTALWISCYSFSSTSGSAWALFCNDMLDVMLPAKNLKASKYFQSRQWMRWITHFVVSTNMVFFLSLRRSFSSSCLTPWLMLVLCWLERLISIASQPCMYASTTCKWLSLFPAVLTSRVHHFMLSFYHVRHPVLYLSTLDLDCMDPL